MKRFVIIALFLFIAGFLFAQEVGTPNPAMLGIDAAQQELKEVSVDKFEHDGFWRSSMSSDDGYVTSRLLSALRLPSRQFRRKRE